MQFSWHPQITRLHLGRSRRRAEIKRFPDTPIRDPRGGMTTIDALLDRAAEAHERINAEERSGSEKHRRISRGQRRLVRALPLLDSLIVFWFLAGVLNADLRTIDATTVIAMALALLCTLAVAAWNAVVGQHLRRFKDAHANLVWDAIDGIGRCMIAVTAGAWALLAAMMYVRVSDEVYQATGVLGVAALIIALALACALALMNAYVLYLSFNDGSSATAELDQIGRAVAPHLRRRSRWLAQEERAARRIEARLAAQVWLHRPSGGDVLREPFPSAALPFERNHQLRTSSDDAPSLDAGFSAAGQRPVAGASPTAPPSGDPGDDGGSGGQAARATGVGHRIVGLGRRPAGWVAKVRDRGVDVPAHGGPDTDQGNSDVLLFRPRGYG